MGVLKRMCHIFRSKPPLGAVDVPALAEDIRSGEARPEDWSLDTERQQTPVFEARAKKPWDHILGLLKSVKDKKQRTGLKLTRTKQSHPPRDANELNIMTAAHSDSVAVVEKEDATESESGNRIINRCSWELVSPNVSVPRTAEEKAITCFSSSKTPHNPTAATSLIDRTEAESAKAGGLNDNPFLSDTSNEAATVDEGSGFETHSGQASQYGRSDLELVASKNPNCVSPRTLQNSEWNNSAATIRDGHGVEHPEKVWYDSMSDVNLSTPKFASKYKLTPRPIRLEDVVVYDAAGSCFTPTQYMEMWMRVPDRGINDFVRVRFVMADSLGGRGLILGREIIERYGVVLDPTQGYGSYPVIARTPGPAAIEDKHQAHLQAVENRERAKAYRAGEVSSTAGPTTKESGTSQGEKSAGSSRTSTSSSVRKK